MILIQYMLCINLFIFPKEQSHSAKTCRSKKSLKKIIQKRCERHLKHIIIVGTKRPLVIALKHMSIMK